MNRVLTTKIVLWSLLGFAGAVGLTRFVFGLGATTNLSDATPWGMWIGFDVLAGVALAAGGFVMCAIFYITKREEFKPLVRPAVLTAFLGYLAVIIGLLFDLGLPWNIWHMMVYWNPHSPLFEVGWCVMLYTTVLALEFSPVPLEATSRYARVRKFLMKLRLPLVILGIMLSTLHQSSLGSLFLIMPHRLDPLWYSPLQPLQFFVSAVALGMMMVALESIVSHWLYRRSADTTLIAKLAKFAVWVLGVYFVIRMGGIVATGKTALIFDGSRESWLFITEILMSTIIPILIFSSKRLRLSPAGQLAGSLLVVMGMVFNRLNVGGIATLRPDAAGYVPSLMEIIVSVGVVSAAGLVFMFAVERFSIWSHRPQNEEADPYSHAHFDRAAEVWLGAPAVAARNKYSLAFVLCFALGIALIPGHRLESKGVVETVVRKARGGHILEIDGNLDLFGTPFNHAAHIDSLGHDSSCVKCHHMNMPMDQQSGCWECHRGMYTVTDDFGHDWHTSPTGANIACNQCHQGQRTAQTAKKCTECHTDQIPAGATIAINTYKAPSYVDAMHGMCIACHRQTAKTNKTKAGLTQCATCHPDLPSERKLPFDHFELKPRTVNRVMLPAAPTDSLEENGS